MSTKRRAARRLALQRPYKPPEGPATTRQGSIPPPSALLLQCAFGSTHGDRAYPRRDCHPFRVGGLLEQLPFVVGATELVLGRLARWRPATRSLCRLLFCHARILSVDRNLSIPILLWLTLKRRLLSYICQPKNPEPLQTTPGETQPDVSARLRPQQTHSSGFVTETNGESVANFIGREKQIQILRLLVEGNSIRSTERLTGIHRDTIMRAMVRFGNACREFLDLNLSNLHLEHVEIEEIWTFVRKKQRQLHGFEIIDPEIGDIYLFTAIDQKTKLLASFAIGKRNHFTTQALIGDLSRRMVRPPVEVGSDRPQLSTDGWASYPSTIRDEFGTSVRHGILIKQYRNPESGRYAPLI